MDGQVKRGPEGLWFACERMEAAAFVAIHKQLADFEPVIMNCYETGVQTPTLPANRHNEPDLSIAALFLKKALNDLRSTWLLIRLGYTSQAASVAASLFENSLTVVCIAGKPKNLEKLNYTRSGDLPWSPQQLSKIQAEQWRDEARITGSKFEQENFELAWRDVYASYKWLCKIKHPTIGSALHDATSTLLDSREYVVMAAPDIRPEDVAVKATILAISVNRIREALRSFSFALECDITTSEYQNFVERMNEINKGATNAFKTLAVKQLPFLVNDLPLFQEWTNLRQKNSR